MSPDSLLVAAKVAVRDTDSAAQIARGHRHGRTPGPRRRTHRQDASTSSRISTTRPGPTRRDPADPRRPAQPLAHPARRRRPHEARQPRKPRPADRATEPRDRPPSTGRSGWALPRDSRRRARSFSKSRARPGVAGMRPRRRPRSATAARTGGSASTRRPNASDAGLMWYRRSSSSAAATASRSASLNCRCAARPARPARLHRGQPPPRAAPAVPATPPRSAPDPARAATAAGRGPAARGRDPRGSGACAPTCRAAGRPLRCA